MGGYGSINFTSDVGNGGSYSYKSLDQVCYSYMAKLHEHNILLPFLHTEFINHGIIIIIEHASYALLYLL